MSEAEAIALEASNLGKRYRDGSRVRQVVRDVNLALPYRSLWVLRGPSGSGKSTLLALLCGLAAPSEGEVRLHGEPFSRLRDHHRSALRRASIGVVFQGLGLIDRMSVLENVLLPSVPLGGPSREQRARAGALLARFGLADKAAQVAARLSGGERQRAAIARALLTRPRIVVLDEPTAHLDAERAAEVATLLSELRDEGHAVLAATHDPRLSDHPAVDRTLELRDGALQC